MSKTVTLPLEEFLKLEGDLRTFKKREEQQDQLITEFLLEHSPEQLQAIRSNPGHPFWEQADRQLQLRSANNYLSNKGQKK